MSLEISTEEEAPAVASLFPGIVGFALAAPRLDILPADGVPEVAVTGRSNVGKSSLLNALTGRGGLARTSRTPGRTQELIVFDVGNPLRLRLIDMPGYGFAEAPRAVIVQWGKLCRQYLRGRPVLKRVFVLIDARHGVKPIDLDMMAMLDEAAVSYQLVLTKLDKLKPAEQEACVVATAAVARTRAAAYPEVIATSSTKGDGIEALRAAVSALATQSS